jgi:hypothetical protein
MTTLTCPLCRRRIADVTPAELRQARRAARQRHVVDPVAVCTPCAEALGVATQLGMAMEAM